MGSPTPENKPQDLTWVKDSINLVLIGESGHGKTSLLNLLVNACLGVRALEDFTERHSSHNESGGSRAGSQTRSPRLYSFVCPDDGRRLNILDTPGLADTNGISRDAENKEAIANAIKDLGFIDAVIIVANGTLERLGASTTYTLETISSMFPLSIADNLCFVFTMVSNDGDLLVDTDSLPGRLRKTPYWCINNPFARWQKIHQRGKPSEVTRNKIREEYQTVLETLALLIEHIDKRTRRPTIEIYQVYNMSTNVEAAICDLVARMEQEEAKCSELENLQKDKEYHWQKVRPAFKTTLISLNHNRFAQYEEIISEPIYQHEPTDRHNTLCTASECYSNCHIDCQERLTIFPSTWVGNTCHMFKNGRNTIGRLLIPMGGMDQPCKSCGHAARAHAHYRSRWVKTRNLVSGDPAFHDTTAQAIAVTMQRVERDIGELKRSIEEQKQELVRLCDEYNEMALPGNFGKQLASTIQLLEFRERAEIKRGNVSNSILRSQIEDMKKRELVLKEVVGRKGGIFMGLGAQLAQLAANRSRSVGSILTKY
ncbi:hypothetical protein V5O48_010362 [Marasmius crinis-equi]|uniref:AIG1-type G domain-containing protein n=1 Tax=Marasmius crinis-equi TaxID=585013 RepID=A0ABR3F8I6_9AGAR